MFRRPSGSAIGFVELSRRMLAEVGIRRGIKRLSFLRNRIVHTGLSLLAPAELHERTDAVRILILQYLFRLLGFRGHFQVGLHRATA
jgi:hypothetical protein